MDEECRTELADHLSLLLPSQLSKARSDLGLSIRHEGRSDSGAPRQQMDVDLAVNLDRTASASQAQQTNKTKTAYL